MEGSKRKLAKIEFSSSSSKSRSINEIERAGIGLVMAGTDFSRQKTRI